MALLVAFASPALSSAQELSTADSSARALFGAIDGRWNAHDAAGMAALHTPDAEVAVRGLPRLLGRAAIEATFGRLFAATTTTLRHQTVLDDASMVTPDVMLLDGRILVTEAHGDSAVVRAQMPFIALAVRSPSGWQIRMLRAPSDYTGAPAPGRDH